ncbi:MAG: hypothetical protein K9H26_00170 [Prolixibacteraceae bacterium]|nr:hypothetical protein [Prolixibacteraceae bacterium]
MKLKKYILPLMLALFMSGCVVFSFYPIYTEDDLFPNEYLLGEYMTDDSASWNFDYIYTENEEKKKVTDSLGYILKINENHPKKMNSQFEVHLIELNGQLIADFYLEDYQDSNEGWELAMFDLHIIPVHSFALLDLRGDTIVFKWFDPGWLEEQIKANKVRIHHEKNDNTILLTAKPKELQKFVKKYLNSSNAFEDGLELELIRKK